ncbi:group I intron-associated PD-(D/E)XK endonuclease [Abyssicoccus albus]|uniref:PD(D/E)XK endonuclease domain-containing protein n=1 Tax=Abyssicoccus albus TaxID=1817405 RepID=A0A3N5BBK3_9BACL|nr:group I intron-associated PD-(D/E)XK endonuclease [Abyssicoccus albus]RPF54773.1 hypothetical protein EDD62_1734 [Abyssicoccus albus]
MASYQTSKGTTSELIAQELLTSKGFSVHTPISDESYDLIAHENGTRVSFRVQVKTLQVRTDRENALVVKAVKSNGRPYTVDEVDYILAVDLDNTTGYLVENTGQKEYWSKDYETAERKWSKLSFGTNEYGDVV